MYNYSDHNSCIIFPSVPSPPQQQVIIYSTVIHEVIDVCTPTPPQSWATVRYTQGREFRDQGEREREREKEEEGERKL